MYGALKEEGFLVFCVDPGTCVTNFTGNVQALRVRGASEPEVGAERIARVVRGDEDSDVGKAVADEAVPS